MLLNSLDLLSSFSNISRALKSLTSPSSVIRPSVRVSFLRLRPMPSRSILELSLVDILKMKNALAGKKRTKLILLRLLYYLQSE